MDQLLDEQNGVTPAHTHHTPPTQQGLKVHTEVVVLNGKVQWCSPLCIGIEEKGRKRGLDYLLAHQFLDRIQQTHNNVYSQFRA